MLALGSVGVDQPKDWRRGFLTIAAGQTVSLVGSSAVQFALIWWLASETASPLLMSMAGLSAFLPQLLLGPIAGVWVDRLSRKSVVICADLFIGLVATLFAAAFLVSNPPYWSACLVLGLRAVGGTFHMPAIQAVVPMLVPKEELVRANGWSRLMQSGAFMVGPVLGAALYATLPLPAILLSDLVGAVVASISIAVVKIPELQRTQRLQPSFLTEMKEGVVVYLRDKRLFIVTLATVVSLVFFMPLSSLYPLMVSDIFKATAWHASITSIAYSLGMMIGAAVISGLGEIRDKLGVVRLGLVVLGAASFLCGILPPNMVGFWLFVVLDLVMGASVNLYSIPYMAYLQETIPNEAQGRAFSFMGSLMSITMPVGLLIAGPVAEHYGVPFWFLVAGVAMIIVITLSTLVPVPQD